VNNDEQKISKNLKLMSLSAIILLVLLTYSFFASNYAPTGSYYMGVFFLLLLIVFAFVAQKYKYKLRDFLKTYITPKVQTSTNMHSQAPMQTSFKEQLGQTNNDEIKPVVCDVKLSDIAGARESKEEIKELIDFLHNPQKYKKHKVSLPKGVLLVGPPGVGKTMLAKALSYEANVPFYYASGASFVHIYVGMGAKRVRELFAKARANSPCIVFIDEIDSIGKKRGDGSNDERDSTLNELLTQMDGFDDSSFVLVLAATNKVEVLDDALLRAKRFDRKIHFALPNVQDRAELISSCLKGRKHNINIENLANDTSALNFAAISTLINEAILNMIRTSTRKVLQESDIEVAKKKVKFGINECKLLDKEQKDILATYQAGVAFLAKEKVFLTSTKIEQKELVYPSLKELKKTLMLYLAGDEALRVFKKDSFLVDESNIANAYELANKICEQYKMHNNKQELMEKLKSKLKAKITKNKDVILRLKQKLLKDEFVEYK